MYAVAIDALKESRMAKARSDKRKELVATAKKIALEVHEQFPKAEVPFALWRFIPQNLLSIDDLAKMFGLPEYDDLLEQNQDWMWEQATQYVDADAFVDDEDAYNEEVLRAQQEAETAELYNPWYDAVMSVANRLFEMHRLTLTPAWPKDTTKEQRAAFRPWQWRIEPEVSWSLAAEAVMETINGVGPFHYSSLKEFLSSGPYSPQEAVIEHLGWIRRAPDVYGEPSARAMYDRAFR